MNWSVAETFDRIRNRLPASLSRSALDRCARIAARVPDDASSHYLEYRLNVGSRVDFLTCSRRRSIAARFDEQLGTNRSRIWAENVAILREWAANGSELSAAPFVWFEYDGGDDFVAEEPEASLVIGLEEDYTSRHWKGFRGAEPETAALGRVAYRRLLPDATRQAYMSVLERCYAALPPMGAMPHAAVMSAREPITAKPYVILPRESLFDFLDKVGWPGSREALDELLRTYYAPFRKSIYIDLTVTDRVNGRLGIATSQFQRLEADFSSLDWWRLPTGLAHFRDELRGWPGHSEEMLGGQRVWIHRWLDTKAVLNGTEIEYKAYLGFSPTRLPLFC